MWRNVSIGFILVILLAFATGCQLTQSAFSRIAGDTGAAFAAAATTLQYVHDGKISTNYASASFMSFQSELSGLNSLLPSQQGVPDTQTLHRLLDLYSSAMVAVNHPCLDESCDWQAQLTILKRASEAFLKAGGS